MTDAGGEQLSGGARTFSPGLRRDGDGAATTAVPTLQPRAAPASPAPPAAAASPAPRTAATVPARRGPWRARLQLARLDPWSVLKVTFVFSMCLLVVFVVATAVLYGVLDSMGVFHAVQNTVHSAVNLTLPLSAVGIIGGAAVLGLVNVVLLSALATIGAFVYNITAALVGGVEVVLTEPE